MTSVGKRSRPSWVAQRHGNPNHKRVVEKLGWVCDFKADVQLWGQYRRLIGEVLKMAGEQGVYSGASGNDLISFYEYNEAQLNRLDRPGLRLPSSTEVLESAFGGYKMLQGDHGRGTFTSLLSVFATQFDRCTAAKIRERFARVSNKEVKEWVMTSGLADSTQSRRTRVYREARASETLFSAA
jgi:hypothetical protein